MKTIHFIVTLVFLSMILSCASTHSFPVSEVIPAAEISVKKAKDKNNNYTIELTAKYLASPERLSPPRKNYSVWIILENGDVKNVGQLSGPNGKTVTLKTVTPFNVREIFITAEDRGDNIQPLGIEISRTQFPMESLLSN